MDAVPDSAEAAIAVLYTIAACLISSVGIPQTLSLIRRWRNRDGLQLFRLLWVVLGGTFCLFLAYRALVWIDVSFFDQRYLGPIATRWPLEVVIALMVTLASGFCSWLYWRTRRGVEGRTE